MSLIAWYPLNGDTKDYSGNELHLTNNGATIDINGKIGSCYLTNHKNNQTLNVTSSIITNALSNGNDFTISFWQKVTSVQSVMNIACGNTSSANKMLHIGIRSTATVSMAFYGDDLNGTYHFSENKWYHITAIYQKGYQKIYVNGSLINSRKSNNNLVVSGSFEIGKYSNTAVDSFYNDVRIYNEALSTKQIKEIAQAKICHYTFNEEMYENTTNLYANYPELSGMVTTDNSDCKIDRVKLGKGHYRYKIYQKVTKKNWPNVQFPVYAFTPGKQYTISIDIKIIETRNKAGIALRHSALNNDYGTPGRQVINLTNAVWGQWKRYTLTRSFETTTTLNGTTYNTSPRIEIYTDMHNEGDYLEFEIKNYQVEEKDHATPFASKNRTQILKDISGYNHHMTTYTEYSPIWKQDHSDIRIKGYSSLSNKASYYCENFQHKYPDAFTFSCWIKTTDDEGFCLIGFPSGNNTHVSLCMRDNAKISLHSYYSTPESSKDVWYASSKTSINDNKWHLIAVTYDGAIVKSYVDGKFESSSNVTLDFIREPVKNLSINLLDPSSDFKQYEIRRFNGDISDVRIYATALSDEDIKLLYQPETNIDKSNVIRCSEINEKEMIVSESIKIVSAGYGANQGKHKVSIGDKYSTTERAVGWCVTSIDINKNITHKTFKTHNSYSVFITLKQYVDSLPVTNTILLSTYDQPSVYTTSANNDDNCKSWVAYLRDLGSTQIDNTFKSRAAYAAIIQGRKIIAEGIHNTDTDSMVALEKIVNLQVNNQGFYKNASIACNEFNEVPNIKSGVHNLKLGNEILPVLIDMDSNGGRWARVFYHNCKSGTVLFSKDNSYAEAKETNKATPTGVDKYSILSKLESFRSNTKSSFEFKLRYPTYNKNAYNIWKQTSNPTCELISGYVPVQISWTTNLWGGLEYSGNYTFIDGSVNSGNWFYAIGVSSKYSDGMPMFNGATAHDVELWIRINNYDLFADNLINNVSISRDGVLTAKEFREI